MEVKNRTTAPKIVQSGTVSDASDSPLFDAFKRESLKRFQNRDWGDVSAALQAENSRNQKVQLGKYDFPEFIELPGQTRLMIVADDEIIIIFFASDAID